MFQPHRYSRTKLLWEEFGQCFSNADVLFLAEIYPAGEEPIEGVSSELICQAIKKHSGRDTAIVGRFEDIAETVASEVREGDVVLTLGAGDIYKAGPAVLEILNNRGTRR